MSIMKNSIHAAAVEKEAGQVVLAFINALNEEDFRIRLTLGERRFLMGCEGQRANLL